MAGAPCPPQPLAPFPECWPHLHRDPGLPLPVPHRGSWDGRGPSLHLGPAAAPVSQAGLETLCWASAVSSCPQPGERAAGGTHDSSGLPAPTARPALRSTCGLPGNTCDPLGQARTESPAGRGHTQTQQQGSPGGRQPQGQAPSPDCTGHRPQPADVSAGIFPLLMSPLPPPPQSGCSCQDHRLELQVWGWPAARLLPCLSAREEAGPPLESFTLSSFRLSHLSPGSVGSAALAPSLSSPAPLRLQCG